MAKKHDPDPDNFWVALSLANLLLCVAFLLFFAFLMMLIPKQAHALEWQWPIKLDTDKAAKLEQPPTLRQSDMPSLEDANPMQRPKPPNVQPYQFPTYEGRGGDFKATVPELAPFPDIDTDAIYQVVVNCFPERVPWGLEVKAVAGARYTDTNNTVSTFDTAGLSKYYAGLVAEIPLYSASEINTERRTEYQRRTQLSDNVAKFLQSLAAMRRAWREIGIYNGATLRSQRRVSEGIAETSEQIGYVEKVAQAYSKLDDAKAAVDGARLALFGQCRNEVADGVNSYLKAVVDDFVRRAKADNKLGLQ